MCTSVLAHHQAYPDLRQLCEHSHSVVGTLKLSDFGLSQRPKLTRRITFIGFEFSIFLEIVPSVTHLTLAWDEARLNRVRFHQVGHQRRRVAWQLRKLICLLCKHPQLCYVLWSAMSFATLTWFLHKSDSVVSLQDSSLVALFQMMRLLPDESCVAIGARAGPMLHQLFRPE